MSKARLYLILAAALVLSLAFAAPALAWTHGQFSATTDACAGCHVAHAAQAPKLLKTGPTQTELCFLCHGDGGVSAPYDVKIGKTTVGGITYASTAGGFVQQYVNGTEVNVTSRHNVWGLVGESGSVIDQAYKVFTIPGSGLTSDGAPISLTGNGFVCSSCHDPHDGGTVPVTVYYGWPPPGTNPYPGKWIRGLSTQPNPRLLRKKITVVSSAYTNLYVCFGMETVGSFAYSAVDSGVYRVITYGYGSPKWCGACHNKFMTLNHDASWLAGSGHAENYFGMWRHPMEAHVWPPDYADISVDSGSPPEKYPRDNVYKIGCLTCHRAHSTVASMNGWATSWPRERGMGGTSTTSALLRMNNRGVCYNCHGAAQYNLPRRTLQKTRFHS